MWVAQGPRGVVGIEQAHDIEAEISLQPYDVHEGAVKDLDDARVGKDVIQHPQLLAPRLERIDDPVLISSADLHQRDEANVRSGVVVLEIDGKLLGLSQLRQHRSDPIQSVDEDGGRLLEGRVDVWIRVLVDRSRILQADDLFSIWMFVAVGGQS